MAVIDGSTLPFGFSIGVRSSTPPIRVDDARFGTRRILVRGTAFIGGKAYTGEIVYFGRFKYSGNDVSGKITRADLFPDDGGVFQLKKIDLSVDDIIKKSAWAVEKQILAGKDKIIGSKSTDILKGLGGDDTLIGGGGTNRLTGGAGVDTFVLSNKGIQVITDFDVREDRINLPGPVSGYGEYEWFRKGGDSFIAKSNNIIGKFLGGPNLDNATFV
ncbi:MAG: hypothetical protein WBN89_00590 [Prochlorococcaceae cyanobacterium]